MNQNQLRKKYLEFIKSKGFEMIPSASLVPENDPSVLFTTAGVQPLVSNLMGEKHPKGNKISNIQKCIRTQDIEDVGDEIHDTFFEMLGYWYLGKESSPEENPKKTGINTTYEMFFTEKGFNLDINKAYITCFEGNSIVEMDTESSRHWKDLGVSESRIFYTVESNWWETGETGPCGPDTEVYYNVSGEDLNIKTKDDFLKADKEGKLVEIGNTVFMLFEKKNGKIVGELKQQNVDFGGGLERILMALQGTDSIFETDVLYPIYSKLFKNTHNVEKRVLRILADHLRTSVMMISDGVLPSNTDQGYILRRLVRRVVRFAKEIDLPKEIILDSATKTRNIYNDVYKISTEEEIRSILNEEIEKFERTLEKGLREFEKMSKDGSISGKEAFVLFTTHGFPFEITKELANEKGIKISDEEFEEELKKHKELSKTASAGKFKGGLAGDSETEIKYHTATHLLNAALRKFLGGHVYQRGSNINSDRMRFDFSHDQKIESETLDEVENQVNEWINENIPVERVEMTYYEAKDSGVIGVFDDKYGDTVSVYKIGDISAELCGGPHVKSTGEIGKFKIKKEESSSKGVRRIKAVIE